jgi:hypothetical protein
MMEYIGLAIVAFLFFGGHAVVLGWMLSAQWGAASRRPDTSNAGTKTDEPR